MDTKKTAEIQATLYQMNLLCSTITHTKLTNAERTLLNNGMKRLEREFLDLVLPYGSLQTADEKLPEPALIAAPAPVRKLTKKAK